jgi:hypothetical protein
MQFSFLEMFKITHHIPQYIRSIHSLKRTQKMKEEPTKLQEENLTT